MFHHDILGGKANWPLSEDDSKPIRYPDKMGKEKVKSSYFALHMITK